MATNDPWTGVTWNVYGGGPNVKPPSQAGQFSLTAVADPVKGATAYYRVTFSGGGMPAPWNNLLLYPLGSVPVPPLPSPLPPWSPETDAQWSTAAASALAQVTATTARLEGSLNPGTNAKALTLVQVANATTQGSALLAIGLKSSSGGVQPLDDGTGYGNDGG